MSNDSALSVYDQKLPVEPGPLPWSWSALDSLAGNICLDKDLDLVRLESELMDRDPSLGASALWPLLSGDSSVERTDAIQTWRQSGDESVDLALNRLWQSGLFLSQAIDRTAQELGVTLPFRGMAWSVLLQGHFWKLAASSAADYADWLASENTTERHRLEIKNLGVRASLWSQLVLQKAGLDELAQFLWTTRDLTTVSRHEWAEKPSPSPVLQVLNQAFSLYSQSRYALVRSSRAELAMKDPKVSLIEARVDRIAAATQFLAPADSKLVERTQALVRHAMRINRQNGWINQASAILNQVEYTAKSLLPVPSILSATKSQPEKGTPGSPTHSGPQSDKDLWLTKIAVSWDQLQHFWWNQLERFDTMSDTIGYQQVRSESHAQALRFESLAEFAAGAGHELNNPLAVIQGRAQLLLAKATDLQTKQSLKAIVDQTLRAHRMLRDLIYIARPSEPVQRYFRPVESVRSVVRELQDEAQRREINIEWNACPLAGRFDTEGLDPDAFRQIVLGLTRNAIEASSDQALVQIQMQMEPGNLKLQVIDHGHGFDSHEAAHLFDPFYCGRKAGRGLGLGLPRLARAVAQMNGKIRYRSRPAQGSTFEVIIPVPSRTAQSITSSA